MAEKRAVLDTWNEKLFLCGPGGYQLTLSPGTRVYKLRKAASGHLLLPCTQFAGATQVPTTVEQSLTRAPSAIAFQSEDPSEGSSGSAGGNPGPQHNPL